MDPSNETDEVLEDMDNTQNEQPSSQRKKKFKLINGVKMKVKWIFYRKYNKTFPH